MRPQELLEPQNRVDVQAVGRLVQQEDVRFAKNRLGQQHADLVTVVKVPDQNVVAGHGNTQPTQELTRLSFGFPAVELAELSLQLRRTHPVRLVEARLRVQRIFLLHDRIQAPMPHQHGGQRIELVEGEVVLFEDRQSQARGDGPRPECGSISPDRILRKVDLGGRSWCEAAATARRTCPRVAPAAT